MAESVSKPHEQAYGMLSLQHGQDCFRFVRPAYQACRALVWMQASRYAGLVRSAFGRRLSFNQGSLYVLMILSSMPGLQCSHISKGSSCDLLSF